MKILLKLNNYLLLNLKSPFKNTSNLILILNPIILIFIVRVIFLKEICAENLYCEMIDISKEEMPTKLCESSLVFVAGNIQESINVKEQSPELQNKYGIDTDLFLTFWVCGTLLSVLFGK